MWQYSRIFGTVRVPGEEIDHLEQYPKSKHIAVICNNRFYKVDVYDESGQLSPTDLQIQFTRILEDAEGKNPDDEPNVGCLPSADRTTWAKMRFYICLKALTSCRKELIEMDEVNNKSLEAIETALFVVIFDEESPSTVEELAEFGMHRKGKPMWYDKNLNMIMFKNGRFTANVDHTFADASVMVHVFDFVFSVESSVDHWVKHTADIQLPPPQKLEWKVTPEFNKKIAEVQAKYSELAKCLEINVSFFG